MHKSMQSGYQFKCDACESEVEQVPPPELCIVNREIGSGRRRSKETLALQCCEDCARQIKTELDKIAKKDAAYKRQAKPLRNGIDPDAIVEPTADIEGAGRRKPQDNALEQINQKLDGLTGAITSLINAIAPKLVSPNAESSTEKPKEASRPATKRRAAMHSDEG